MEAVDHELHDEHEQEDGRDLKEPREIDAVAVARPEPGDERGDERAGDGAADDVDGTDLEEQRVHQQRRLHALLA